MRFIIKVARMLRLLLFACIFSICMVLGVVPVVPKRKEEAAVEVKASESEEEAGIKF